MNPFEMTLAAAPDAPAAARVALTAWMAGHVTATMLTDAELLVGELVANSVRHADAPADAVVSVRAQVRADVLYLEVADGGTGGSITRRVPDLQRGGGFGLNVVEALTRRWGVNRDAGTRVWAELAVPVTGDAGDESRPPMRSNTIERDEPGRAVAARKRAASARRRAVAEREAADRATTDYARRAHHRAADLHTQLAVSHEDFARTLRRGGGDREGR